MRILITWAIVFLATWMKFGIRRAVSGAAHAARDVLRAFMVPSERTPPLERLERRKACDACPMHFDGLDTCGVPGDVGTEGRKVGCWCPTEASTYVRSKRCYLGEEYGESRWP